MEVLKRRNKNQVPARLIAVAGIVYVFLIAFFVWRQFQLEMLGRESAQRVETAVAAAVLEDVRGQVFVLRQGSVQRRMAEEGREIFPGDEIQTTDESSVLIRFDAGTSASLGGNSLLMIHAEKNRNDTVVELSNGEINVDSSSRDQEKTIVLKTPGASIRLDLRKSVLFRAENYGLNKASTVVDDTEYEKIIANGYVEFFRDIAVDFPKAAQPAIAHIGTLSQGADAACDGGGVSDCLKARDEIWRELLQVRREYGTAGELELHVTVAPDRKERIEVSKGVVSVETSNRVVTVAQGDAAIELAPGVVVTRRSVSENARDIAVEEQEELFFNIEKITW